MKKAEGPEGSGKLQTIIEGVQYPGETIFVPGNWWHAVLNLDLTVAITQNFVNYGNFERVWLRTRKGRKKLSVNFLAKLKIHKPDLYEKAVALNTRDGFVMWNEREDFKHKFLPRKERKKVEAAKKAAKKEKNNLDSSDSSSSSSSSSSSDSKSCTSSSEEEESSSEDEKRSASKHRSPVQ